MAQVAVSYCQHPPDKNTTNILLVGMEGIGKGVLAKTIVQCRAEFGIQCYTATSVDQVRETASSNRIDFILLMVDTSRRISFDMIVTMLDYVDAAYFLGRCCFVVPRRGADVCYEDDDLMTLAGRYQVSVLFTNVTVEADLTACASSVVKMAGTAAGLTPGVSAMFIK